MPRPGSNPQRATLAPEPGRRARSGHPMLEVVLGLGGAYIAQQAVEFATSARTGPMTPGQAAASRGIRCRGHFIHSNRVYYVAKARPVCRVGVTRGTCIFGLDRNRDLRAAVSVSSPYMRHDECRTLRSPTICSMLWQPILSTKRAMTCSVRASSGR